MIINIKADIPDRWKDEFISMLKRMQLFGEMGHSGWIGLYSDGDGDFRPKFEVNNRVWEFTQPAIEHEKVSIDYGYDAS